MLKLNRDSIYLWRRALLIRYYKILGNEAITNVKWTDYDSKSKIITVSDEKSPLNGKSPSTIYLSHQCMLRSTERNCLSFHSSYTTQTALIQGQMTLDWTKSEYPKINKAIK